MRKYDKTELEQIVKQSYSFAEVLDKVGIRKCGGNYSTIKKKISEFNLDTSHFTGPGWTKGKDGTNAVCRTNLEDILKKNTNYKSDALKKRLWALGMKEQKCEVCGITEWQGKEISLELHHINGNHYDNRFENLQVLCPNCHSQTPNFRNKNKTKYDCDSEPISITRRVKTKICEQCGKEFQPQRNTTRFCSRECYNQFKNHDESQISLNDLQDAINVYSDMSNLAKHFNVSRPTIRKYLNRYDLLDSFKEKYEFKSKPVLQFDINGNFIQEWDSVTEAHHALKIHQIEKVCNGQRKTAGGFKWKYKE